MGLLARIFGAVSRNELNGIRLETTQPYWEVSGESSFPPVLRSLTALLPDGCILYFEGGSPSGSLADFLQKHSVPEQAHVACGTIWPRPRTFHLPASNAVLAGLAEEMEHRAAPELAVHFHVYREQTVLLEWHDVFSQPMLLSGRFTEQRVRAFCDAVGLRYTREIHRVEQSC